MEIPFSTSDNLYKFITTGGIALMVVSAGLFFTRIESVSEIEYSVAKDQSLAKVEFERWDAERILLDAHYNRQLDRLNRVLSDAAESLKTTEAIPKDERDKIVEKITLLKHGGMMAVPELRSLIDDALVKSGGTLPGIDPQLLKNVEKDFAQLSEKGTKLFDLGVTADKQIGIVNAATLQLKKLKVYCWIVSGICILMFLIGVCFTGLGFYFWYYRYQIIQDDLLKQHKIIPA